MGYYLNGFEMGLIAWTIIRLAIIIIFVVVFIIVRAKNRKKNEAAEQSTLKANGYANLAALGELREKGILTDKEFEDKKAEILLRL